MGIKVRCNTITTKIASGHGNITHLEFNDGAMLETDMVVVSAGIRPITEIATASGLTVNKGIVCDDQMRTSEPYVFAVGECVEHRGKLYGLVEPIWDQAKTLADVITGFNPAAGYAGSKPGTKLKVMGVELASMGETKPALPDDEVVVYREPSRGVYKKLIVRENKLADTIDRVHANIQKDGTFSVVPRIYGGVTSPSELRRIAEVAEKYHVPMVENHRRPAAGLAGH